MLCNYEMDPSLLAPLVPRGTELDTWNGTTYVSLVAFHFRRTRILGIPIPFHRDFEEANLRFYVRRRSGSDVRRGVVFIREIVPRRAVAALARRMYNEPYWALPMRSAIDTTPGLAVRYGWQLGGRWHTVTAATSRRFTVPVERSLEQFIVEPYWGYTGQSDGRTIEYRVSHPPWSVAPAERHDIDIDLTTTYGPALGAHMKQPASVFLADGSAVTVSRPVIVDGTKSA